MLVNKLMKKLLLCVLIVTTLFMVMPIVVSNFTTSYTVEAASVKISKSKKTLVVGQKCTLKITGTKKKVKWYSSKKSVATINSKGKVTAKKNGKTIITAKIGKKKYTCKLTVKKPVSNTVYITKSGKKYHRNGCKYLKKSKIKSTLSNVKAKGYTACSKCY